MKMDARRLVNDLGGAAELKRQLEAKGYVVSSSVKYGRDTIEKWCIRGNIPSEWIMKIMEIRDFKLTDYKIKPKKKRKS